MTWPEFKEFLQKNFDNFRAFLNIVWKKVKYDSQYKNKLVQDWTVYLEYLQSILIEFNSKWTPEKGTMIWYSRKGLSPLVRIEMEQSSMELDSFKKLVKKAVDAKAKAAFWPRSYACKTD